MDLALNNLQRLICHKTQPIDQPTNQRIFCLENIQPRNINEKTNNLSNNVQNLLLESLSPALLSSLYHGLKKSSLSVWKSPVIPVYQFSVGKERPR